MESGEGEGQEFQQGMVTPAQGFQAPLGLPVQDFQAQLEMPGAAPSSAPGMAEEGSKEPLL